jgi:hypothetical protein
MRLLRRFAAAIAEWWRDADPMRRALALLVVSGSLLLFVFHVALPQPQIRTHLRGITEAFDVVVENPDAAAFVIGGMMAVPDTADEGSCVNGLLVPSRGSRLAFARVGTAQLAIAIEAIRAGQDIVARVREDNGAVRDLQGPLRLLWSAACSGEVPDRIPIHGDAAFGRIMRFATLEGDELTGRLSEAHLTMFGQAIEHFLWLIDLPHSLYPIADMALPGGIRVSADRGDDRAAPVWWGLAMIGKEKDGIAIEAMTGARSIVLTMPGADTGDTRFLVGDFFQLASDPNARWVFFLIAVLLALVQLVPVIAPERRHPAPAYVWLAICLTATVPANAEPVRLAPGGQAFGQGWMFTDGAGVCRIVTAAHVIRHAGVLVAPVAVDRLGNELPTAEPLQPDPDVDIAFLTASPARVCPAAGLSESTVDARLAATPQGFLEFLESDSTGTLPLIRRERSLDQDGGRIVAFDRTTPMPRITQGMSGGMIVDSASRPLAVIIETLPDHNRAVAVRVDVAAVLLRAAQATRAPATLRWSVQHGRSADPLRGPDAMREGGSGWAVEPDRGFIVLTIMPAAATRIGGLMLRVDEAGRGRVSAVDVYGTANPSQPPSAWPAIATCGFPAGSSVMRCDFAPRSVAAIRLQLQVSAPRIALGGFALIAP